MLLSGSTEIDEQALRKLAYTHILSVGQFDRESVQAVLRLSRQMEADERARRIEPLLAGRSIGGIFSEHQPFPALSYQSAVLALGGRWLSIDGQDALSAPHVAPAEHLYDNVKMLACYADAIVLRHPRPGAAGEAARAVDTLRFALDHPTPIISAGDRPEDPSQAFADLYTIERHFGSDLSGLTIGFLGDLRSGGAAHALLMLLVAAQHRVNVICIAPPSLSMPAQYVELARTREISIDETDDIQGAIGKLDVLYVTGVQREHFVARHLEELSAKIYGFPFEALDAPRRDALRTLAQLDVDQEYMAARDAHVIDPMMLSQARKEMIVLHPLPRTKEIPEAADTDDRAFYFQQLRNALYIRMALLAAILP